MSLMQGFPDRLQGKRQAVIAEGGKGQKDLFQPLAGSRQAEPPVETGKKIIAPVHPVERKAVAMTDRLFKRPLIPDCQTAVQITTIFQEKKILNSQPLGAGKPGQPFFAEDRSKLIGCGLTIIKLDQSR